MKKKWLVWKKHLKKYFNKAIELGGTITGEHGVGAMKLPYLHLKVGEAGLKLCKILSKRLIRITL